MYKGKIFGLTMIVALLSLATMSPFAQQVPQPELVDICTPDGVGGNLEPGDNPDVLASVFTLICADPNPGNNFGVVITKFLINWLPNNAAPFSDITDLQIRFFNDVTGEKKWEGEVRDPRGLKGWPIPSTRFVGTGPFAGQPFDKQVAFPDGGRLRVEIRPSISNSPEGGEFGVSIQLEGSEGGTIDGTGGAKKVFHGFKTGFIEDPIKEEIEPEFKKVEFKLEPLDAPPSNLNPSDTKAIRKFEVEIRIDDKVTTPELNNTPLNISLIEDTAPISFGLLGTGTFSAGCVEQVDIVDQQTNQSLIGGWQDARDWGKGKLLAFPLQPEHPEQFASLADYLYQFIPMYVADDDNVAVGFSAEVRVHLPYPLPETCGTIGPDERIQDRTPQTIGIGVDIAIAITFRVVEAGKNKQIAQTVEWEYITPKADPGSLHIIYDRAFEKIIGPSPWTFETLDQKEVEQALAPSRLIKTVVILQDEDSSNQDAVKVEQVEVLDNSDWRQACPDPGIVAVQIQDINGNLLGTAPGFGKIELQNPDGTGVIVPDGDMGNPSSLGLIIKLITRDFPEPEVVPGCKLMVKIIPTVIEGKVVQTGVVGKQYTIPLDTDHIQVPWQAVTVGIKSVQVPGPQEVDVEITVDTPFLGRMEAAVIFDANVDVERLFNVTEVLGAGPYVVAAYQVIKQDVDNDGNLETIVAFIVALPDGAKPSAGTVARIRGQTTGIKGVVKVDFLDIALWDAVGQPIPPPVVVLKPGRIVDPDPASSMLY